MLSSKLSVVRTVWADLLVLCVRLCVGMSLPPHRAKDIMQASAALR